MCLVYCPVLPGERGGKGVEPGACEQGCIQDLSLYKYAGFSAPKVIVHSKEYLIIDFIR